MLTKYETDQMRTAWKVGYDEATAGTAPRVAKDFTGQPSRNFRNYLDGFLHGALDRRAAA